MPFMLIILLLAFPIAEIWVLIALADAYGWGLLVYLVAIGWLGLRLIREEKQLFSARMMQNLTQGGNPLSAMFGSARNMLAGVLLLIPGVITDIIAVVLLLIPAKNVQGARPFGESNNPQDFSTHSTFEERDTGQFKTYTGKKDRFGFFNKKDKSATHRAANDDVIEGEFTREEDK